MSTLFVIPTPIGNLEDITFRAITTLKKVDLVLAEDTRVSTKLFSRYNIATPIKAFHAHNEHKVVIKYIKELKLGRSTALISDAGTPGISDPGFLLVREAIKNNIDVSCLPGATAFVPALITSGIPCDRFVFEGFLPAKKGRKKRFEIIEKETKTMVFYESPHRLLKTLRELSEYIELDRKVSVSREISKVYENTIRGNINEAIEYFKVNKPRGEFVFVLEGK